MDINLGLSATATGTANSITATYSPAPTLVDKKILFLRSAFANTGTVVFNPNSLGQKNIVKGDGSTLVASDIVSANYVMILMFDLANDRWVYLNPYEANGKLAGLTASNYGFTANSTIREALESIDGAYTGFLENTLLSARIFIGNSGNEAQYRALSLSPTGGGFALSNTGALTFPNAATATRGLLTSTDWNTFNGKQATLVSGTNIKTVNNTSLVGSGNLALPTEIQLACSDETTALTLSSGTITFRMPYAMTVTAVRCSLSTAQTSGSRFLVDIHESGTSILSTKLSIENTERTSTTSTIPAVISDSTLGDDAEIKVDIDQVGDGTAAGLKVTIIGTRA